MTTFTRPSVIAPADGRIYPPSYLYRPNPFPQCVGIVVGDCIRGDLWEGESAHAHVEPDDPYRGYICVRRPVTLWDEHWGPKPIMWHEYAHLLEPDDGTGHEPRSPWGLLMQRWGLYPSRVS